MALLLTTGARLLQYGGAVVLFGAPLFFLYGLRGDTGRRTAGLGWPRWGFALAALTLLIGAAAGLSAETVAMTDQPADALRPAALWSVLSGSQFGLAIGARLGLAALALAASLMPGSRGLWAALALLGAGVTASFAWTGHGAMDDGAAGLVHLGADIIHLFAAGLWLGAVAALAALAPSRWIRGDDEALQALHDGLSRFSGMGTLAVALLILTGLVNSWFLVGPDHLSALLHSLYGGVLIAKLLVFALMLVLAARNRYRLTPRLAEGLLARAPERALDGLAWSIGLETAAAILVLVLVGVLGTISPLSMPM